jgi:hypothetical protein
VDREGEIEATRQCARALASYGVRAAAVVLLLHPALAAADFIVPANAIGSINGGTLDLGCTDLIVAGTLQLGGGQVLNVRNVTIQGGGTIDGGSGVIQVGGNWTANGSFAAGAGEVDFRDLCAAGPASISGNTTFFRVSFVSTTSKNYTFAVGSTQRILSVLEISGTSPKPIQFRSATPGQVAFVDLVASGTQQIQHVGVTDVSSTGQCLAPGQSNEGGGGNAKNWFMCGSGGGGGSSTPASIPALDAAALLALAALLAASGLWFVRRATARRKEAVAMRAATARDEGRR